MKELVGRGPRLEHVVVDVTERHRPTDHLRGLLVGPSAPWDQETALGVRMQVGDPREQLLAAQSVRSAGGEDDRNPLPGVAHPLELRKRRLGRGAADDAVVARVPLQLAGDPLDRLRVGIDREDERSIVRCLDHAVATNRESRHSPSRPFSVWTPRSSKLRSEPATTRVVSETRISSPSA